MYQLPYLNYQNVRRNTKQMIIDQLFLLLLKLQKVTKYKICIFESNKHKANKKKTKILCACISPSQSQLCYNKNIIFKLTFMFQDDVFQLKKRIN